MNTKQAAQILEAANAWRRDTSDEGHDAPDPKALGQAIDIAVDTLRNPSPCPSMAALQKYCHDQAREAGWWPELDLRRAGLDDRTISQKLLLIVTEIAEATEGHRQGLMDDKIPHRTMFEMELSDAVIRILDLAGATGCDLATTIAEKLEFNKTRDDHKPENRAKEGGKKY